MKTFTDFVKENYPDENISPSRINQMVRRYADLYAFTVVTDMYIEAKKTDTDSIDIIRKYFHELAMRP